MKTFLKMTIVTVSLLTLSACGAKAQSQLAQADEPVAEINLGDLPPDPSQEFVNLVSVSIKPELLGEFLSVLLPYAELSRQEEGVLRYDIHQSPHDPTIIELYEVYKDTDARIFHNNTEHRNAFFASVGERGFFKESPKSKVVYLIDPIAPKY